MIKKRDNMYERWRKGKLPKDVQREVDASVKFCDSYDEMIFKAGFMVCEKLDRILPKERR